MRNLADTLSRLAAHTAARSTFQYSLTKDNLQIFAEFGSNPGQLTAKTYVPRNIRKRAPLVVVLHGCTQTAAGYDHGAGWSELADRGGFALLFPEQQRVNNANLCFNWFSPEDARRGSGEACSISQMTKTMVAAHGLDERRIFITGLSAGGAMTSVMLATYPDVFAGGAIIAGLPYGVAGSVSEAFDRMRGHGNPDAETLTSLVKTACFDKGEWPTVSIWHGCNDVTVRSTNAEDLAAQWRGVHGLKAAPSSTEIDGRLTRRTWCDASGRERVQCNLISGMGHGVPIDAGVGKGGPYMLNVGISSSVEIALSWRLIAADAGLRPADVAATATTARDTLASVTLDLESSIRPDQNNGGRVRTIIESALRQAGLM